MLLPAVNRRADAWRYPKSWGMANLSTLGWMAMGLYLFSFLAPASILGFVRIGYLVFSSVFLGVALVRKGGRVIAAWPPAIGLVLQLWSVYTALYANVHLGRPLGLGKPDLYIVEAMVPFFVASQLVALGEHQRQRIIDGILIVMAISCTAAWLQFMRIGPAISLAQQYTYKPIDFWDGKPGLRAVGLTMHPFLLSTEGTIGFVAVGYQCLWRKLGRLDIALVLFFSGAAVASQARTGLITLVVLWGIFLVCLWHRDRKVAVSLTIVVACLLLVAGAIGANRLGYLLQSSSTTEDASYSFREQLWQAQLDPIYPKLAMTGVGPNAMIMGTGPEDKWVPIGSVMENAYRLHLASYGIPGLVIYIAMLASGLVGALMLMLDGSQGRSRRTAAVMGFGTAVCLLISSTAANTVDGYLVPQLAWVVCGLCASMSQRPLGRRSIWSFLSRKGL